MRKFFVGFLIGCILSFMITTYVLEAKRFDYFVQKEIELKEKYDADYGGNYIHRHYVQSEYQDREDRSWFNNEYNHLVTAWQRTVKDINDDRMSLDTQADIVRFRFIPFVRGFIKDVESRDLPYKDQKIEILQLRLESLYHIDEYLRNPHDTFHLDEYRKYDSQFRDMIEANPAIVD